MIPFLDLTRALQPLESDLKGAIKRVMDSGRFLNGPEVEAFEGEWARYVGVDHCIAVSSGTDALAMALRALEIPKEDQSVWTPQTGCPATTTGIRAAKMWHTNTEYLSLGTKAAVPVHLYGRLADVPPVPYVVEDCAQAHGTPGAGARHTAAWSFYPTKNLGAFGDAGAVTTNDADVAERVRAMSPYQYGPGRMDEIQAAVLRVKLPWLDRWNTERREIAARYPANGLRGPTNHHLYPLFVDHQDAAVQFFAERNIEVRPYFNGEVCLPCFPGMTREEVDRVAAAAHEYTEQGYEVMQ